MQIISYISIFLFSIFRLIHNFIFEIQSLIIPPTICKNYENHLAVPFNPLNPELFQKVVTHTLSYFHTACKKRGASPRKSYNVGETIFLFLADHSEFSRFYVSNRYTICQLLSLLPLQNNDGNLKFSFPSVFLVPLAIHMISDFIRVTWWRTT